MAPTTAPEDGNHPAAGARIVLEHVSRAYGPATVLFDVSFTIGPGELVALTGPSGSGKTTLLQLIGSLDRPSSGTIRVDDTAVECLTHPADFRRDTVGFVFQLHHLLPHLTVEQNAELSLVAAGIPRRERHERVLDLLEEVGLADRADDFPKQLSGGERQRVAIARALAGRPRLVLADEPTGALDTGTSARIWELLLDLRARHNTTLLVASHDLTLLEHADRELRLVDGRLLPSSSPTPVSELT
ncbi:ABC transporter ATP-binding protein [Conexibacter sp. DBS9H8]|uniref:ABC transporter ATP-binding protein n=1 Tax=Conexibacter sp. DBS9H8 TaxID=2937801 RepID=UPI0020108776|nr:ABC transporter ATP-binding protein [Conexibacter sp. DBS9H8]